MCIFSSHLRHPTITLSALSFIFNDTDENAGKDPIVCPNGENSLAVLTDPSYTCFLRIIDIKTIQE